MIDNLLTLRLRDLIQAHRMSGLYFNYLRSGLDFILKQSSLAELHKKRVLVPAFICPVMPEVFRRNGFAVEFADADLESFNMDLSDLKGASVALVCHTFGAKCDMPQGVTVIEDCAHFLSKERQGDFALYSLTKQLPNIRGGYAETDEDLDNSHLLRDQYTWKEFFFKLNGPHRIVLNFLRTKKGLAEAIEDEKPGVLKANWLVFGHNPEKNLRVYEQLRGHFEKLGLQEFFEMQIMPEGSVPFNFSVRLKKDDPMMRDEILLKLRRKGVFGDRLWYNAHTSGLPNASLLSRTVINLPLHPQSLVKLKNAIQE